MRLFLSFALQICFRHSATRCSTLQLGIPQGPRTITRSTTLATHGNTRQHTNKAITRPTTSLHTFKARRKANALNTVSHIWHSQTWSHVLHTRYSVLLVTEVKHHYCTDDILAQLYRTQSHSFTAYICTPLLHTFAPFYSTHTHHVTAHIRSPAKGTLALKPCFHIFKHSNIPYFI